MLGDFSDTERFLRGLKERKYVRSLADYGKMGVEALAMATPVDTGRTADSWKYSIDKHANGYTITWSNTNINENVNVAVLLQYGHGLVSGGYVRGIDYINPAMRPVFQKIADQAWEEMMNS